MRTIFSLGFSTNPFMGQDQGQPLSPDAVQKFAVSLSQAVDQYEIIKEWKKNHPNLQADLGNDYDNWTLLSQDDTKYGSAAEGLNDALTSNPNAPFSQDDLTAAQNWIQAVNRMYVIMTNHTGKPVPSAPIQATSSPGSPAGPPGSQSGARTPPEDTSTPILIGIGATALVALVVVVARG